MYYGLTNFYQNHRRYVRSRDDNQLHGDSISPNNLQDDCAPYKTRKVNTSAEYGIAPCGAIANSLFNGKSRTFFKLGNIRIFHECEDRIEKSVLRITIWHHKTWRVYPTLT